MAKNVFFAWILFHAKVQTILKFFGPKKFFHTTVPFGCESTGKMQFIFFFQKLWKFRISVFTRIFSRQKIFKIGFYKTQFFSWAISAENGSKSAIAFLKFRNPLEKQNGGETVWILVTYSYPELWYFCSLGWTEVFLVCDCNTLFFLHRQSMK